MASKKKAEPLRFTGAPETLRLGGVYVEATSVSQADVVDAVFRFWASAGATEEAAPAPITSPMFKSEGRLEVVVLPPGPDAEGTPWIGIYDTAAYSQDGWVEVLAEALHAYLKVRTFAYYIGPKTRLVSHGAFRWFGDASKKTSSSWDKTLSEADRFPFPFAGAAASGVDGVVRRSLKLDVATLNRKLEFEKRFWAEK